MSSEHLFAKWLSVATFHSPMLLCIHTITVLCSLSLPCDQLYLIRSFSPYGNQNDTLDLVPDLMEFILLSESHKCSQYYLSDNLFFL